MSRAPSIQDRAQGSGVGYGAAIPFTRDAILSRRALAAARQRAKRTFTTVDERMGTPC
jgi:hypothetical protein